MHPTATLESSGTAETQFYDFHKLETTQEKCQNTNRAV